MMRAMRIGVVVILLLAGTFILAVVLRNVGTFTTELDVNSGRRRVTHSILGMPLNVRVVDTDFSKLAATLFPEPKPPEWHRASGHSVPVGPYFDSRYASALSECKQLMLSFYIRESGTEDERRMVGLILRSCRRSVWMSCTMNWTSSCTSHPTWRVHRRAFEDHIAYPFTAHSALT